MPLSGLRVIDLTRILAGPFATMMLADLGAEVVKVERPGRGDDTRHWGPPFVDGTSTYFLSVNRNKKSLTLDLQAPAGVEVLWELLATADVLVSNFRVGVMERLGFSYDEVHRRCPRVVYAVINGYGDSGPWARRPSYDVIAQAESGLMDLTGEPEGGPTKSGISLADETAGLLLVQGVMAALLERQRSGRGQRVEVALHDALLSLLTYQAQQYLSAGVEPRRLGNAHPSIVPYRTLPTADGSVVVGVASEAMWERFCDATGLEDLAADARFATNADRVRNRDELEPLLAEAFRGRTTGEWLRTLREADVPCGEVASVATALDSEVTRQREMVVELPGAGRVLGVPVKLSRSPGRVRRPPPGLGEQTEAILGDLGHTREEIEALRRDRVI